MLAVRANVCAAPYIQHRRPNGWAGRAENRHKHSLGLGDADRGSACAKCENEREARECMNGTGRE
jgi:hypothetical protein